MQKDQQLVTARIVWAALQASILMYGGILFVTQRLTLLELPSSPTPVEVAALFAPTIYILGLLIFRKKMSTAKTGQEKFLAHIVFWVLNDAIAILGFMASFTNESGNGFFYLSNAAVALLANLRAFPRWSHEGQNN